MEKSPTHLYRCLEVVSLASVILVILGLCLTSTIYFIVFPITFPTTAKILNTSHNCSTGFTYTGRICHNELATQQCSSNASESLRVAVENQKDLEQYLVVLLNHVFPNVNPSPECDAAMRSFICLYSFGMCDGNTTILITRNGCMDVRDEMCEREWRELGALIGPGILPICEDHTDPESGSIEVSLFANDGSDGEVMNMSANSTEPLNCTTQFYYDVATHTCRPMCGWNPYLRDNSAVLEVLTYLSYTTLIFFSLVNVLSALSIERDKMLKFPSFYFLLFSSVTGIIGILVAIGLFDFCHDQDYIRNILGKSSTCSITGTLIVYFLKQATLWLLFYSVVVFWGTTFPFHYRESKTNGKLKYFYITSVVAGLILPLDTGLLFIDGFYYGTVPYGVCIARNRTRIIFYSMYITLSILFWITCSLLVLILWNIFKEVILKKMSAKQKTGAIAWAEIKLLIVVIYFIITILLNIIVDISVTSISPEQLLSAVLPYFTCESIGIETGREDCQELLEGVRMPHFFNIYVARNLLSGLITLEVFLFSTNFSKHYKTINATLKEWQTKTISSSS